MAEGVKVDEPIASDTTSPWCQFVYTHECRPPVLVSKQLFRFGRSPDCDFSIADCKFLSAYHCFIMKDSEGNAWLHDTSTNGTLVNGKKVKSGQSVKLGHKDEIKLVHRKERDVGFVYHDLKCLNDAQVIVIENTQEYLTEDDGDSQTTSVKETNASQDNEKTSEEEKRPGKRPHCQTSSTSETDSPTSKRQHIDENKTNAVELNKINSCLADNLVCNICQDIFHDCVSLQPCMHSYCAGCYSQWMERSHDCPSCRLRVSRINRNHLVNNLVEAFLKENPDKKRPKEEIEVLDKKNKITADMLKPPRQRHGMLLLGDDNGSESDSFEEDLSITSESDHSLSDYDDDDDDNDDILLNPFSGGLFPMASTVAGLFGFTSRGLLNRSRSQVCRQCPSYTPAMSFISPSSSALTTSASTNNTSDGTSATSTTTPPPYVCSPSRSHILCLCCMQYMPDRQGHNDADNGVTIPRQSCCICERAFCHLYWGCRGRCNGCLKEFKDFTFQDSMHKLINDNTYESTILKNYLNDKNIPLDTLWKKCLEKLESKEYKPKDVRCVSSTAIVCQKCALRNFQELAYQYRQDVPRDDLPDFVTERQDCYWGRNCRTQRKPHHATRFNHICEQKRFA